ncbi:nucleotide-binding protein [Pseudoalteromonas sp. NBT06-2]|uniref:TIR domain-containing protein n=1 Tax=Pseudoalteromonas sp. NBT06-2 TaxID=2025950 RepID=UPI001483A21E|nr:nucleotide-binding protein [Pseudoalteromonas sp. NBT06-2]
MKKIFVGSSSEAVIQAENIAAVLEQEGAEVILWTRLFKNGDITFQAIEELSESISGAVILATPDDESVIRNKKVKIPRANVMFEYGFLTARLSRSRVALCKYDDAELPSDFAGVTFIPMGGFDSKKELSNQSSSLLRSWLDGIPEHQIGIAPTYISHGYSGIWHNETIFTKWRGLDIKSPDYAIFRGDVVLVISKDGRKGSGNICGVLEVSIGDCYAQFAVSDLITDAQISVDGSLKLKTKMHSRHRLTLDGTPPQKDGFEQALRGVREFDTHLMCSRDKKGVLRGSYISKIGSEIHTDGQKYWYREPNN